MTAVEDFLHYDSGPSDQRMLVFSTVRNITLLENLTDWFTNCTLFIVWLQEELFFVLMLCYQTNNEQLIKTFSSNPSLSTLTSIQRPFSSIMKKLPGVWGIATKIPNWLNFALQIRMIPALPFIQPDKVIDAFETLQDTVPPEADPITDYFEDTYVYWQNTST